MHLDTTTIRHICVQLEEMSGYGGDLMNCGLDIGSVGNDFPSSHCFDEGLTNALDRVCDGCSYAETVVTIQGCVQTNV